MSNSEKTTILYALDFDGVLVDSASETGQSGFRAAEILWPNDAWVKELQQDAAERDTAIQRFCRVRPCLETGWEAPLILKAMMDPAILDSPPSDQDIMDHFQSTYKPKLLEMLQLTKETCNDALKQARNTWIEQNDAQDWIAAHDFYTGACQEVHNLLRGNDKNIVDRVFVITTKAKDFAIRLLQRQNLVDHPDSSGQTTIRRDHIYGLGSGPKHQVLRDILKQYHQQTGQSCAAVIVEDNLLTLHKIMDNRGDGDEAMKVLPALASWGYNTPEQQQIATERKYTVLRQDDSSSLSEVLNDDSVRNLLGIV